MGKGLRRLRCIIHSGVAVMHLCNCNSVATGGSGHKYALSWQEMSKGRRTELLCLCERGPALRIQLFAVG